MRPFIIGIAGPSGSGKTTVAGALARELDAPVISLDAYYHDLSHVPAHERARTNFDHPDALEHQLLFHQLDALRRGMTVKIPAYDFSTHCRVPNLYRTVAPAEYVIVEGLFLLHWHQIREILDLRIYVSASDEMCFERRRARDIRERGRTPECIASQYSSSVRPMAEKFILPSAAHAQIILDGAADLPQAVSQTISALAERQVASGASR
ncbi:MAG: uridine kinase [Acidobacteriaceae bacterium]